MKSVLDETEAMTSSCGGRCETLSETVNIGGLECKEMFYFLIFFVLIQLY